MENGMEKDIGKQTVANKKNRIVGRVIEVAVLTVVITVIWGLFSLPTIFFFHGREVISNGTVSNSQVLLQPTAMNITCSKDFYLDAEAGLCRPACGQWKPYPDDVVMASAVLVITGCVVGITGGILIVVLSILKYRHMFKFPSILILYQSTTVALFLLVLIIGYMDTQTFLCPFQDATESLRGSTAYCTLFGVSAYYLLKQTLIFWIAHIATVLLVVTFPFKAKCFESSGHFKIIHILVVMVALVVPIGFAVAPMGTGGFIPFYYPNTCVARNNDTPYYALILPDSILCAVGITLLTLLFWILIRKKWRNICTALSNMYARKCRTSEYVRSHSSNSTIPTTALIKVILNFLSNAIIALLGYSAVSSRLQSNYAEELTKYFICESSGIGANKICARTYEALYSPLPLSVSFFLFGSLYLGVNIIYAVNVTEIYKCIRNKTCSSTFPTIATYSTEDNL